MMIERLAEFQREISVLESKAMQLKCEAEEAGLMNVGHFLEQCEDQLSFAQSRVIRAKKAATLQAIEDLAKDEARRIADGPNGYIELVMSANGRRCYRAVSLHGEGSSQTFPEDKLAEAKRYAETD